MRILQIFLRRYLGQCTNLALEVIVGVFIIEEVAIDRPREEETDGEHDHCHADQEVEEISSLSHQQSSILDIDKSDEDGSRIQE